MEIFEIYIDGIERGDCNEIQIACRFISILKSAQKIMSLVFCKLKITETHVHQQHIHTHIYEASKLQ